MSATTTQPNIATQRGGVTPTPPETPHRAVAKTNDNTSTGQIADVKLKYPVFYVPGEPMIEFAFRRGGGVYRTEFGNKTLEEVRAIYPEAIIGEWDDQVAAAVASANGDTNTQMADSGNVDSL